MDHAVIPATCLDPLLPASSLPPPATTPKIHPHAPPHLKIQMGTFQLMVRRSLTAGPAAAAAAAPAAAAAATPVVASLPGGTPMMGASAPATPYISMDEPNPEDSVDEALVYVSAPKVCVPRGRGGGEGGLL